MVYGRYIYYSIVNGFTSLQPGVPPCYGHRQLETLNFPETNWPFGRSKTRQVAADTVHTEAEAWRPGTLCFFLLKSVDFCLGPFFPAAESESEGEINGHRWLKMRWSWKSGRRSICWLCWLWFLIWPSFMDFVDVSFLDICRQLNLCFNKTMLCWCYS